MAVEKWRWQSHERSNGESCREESRLDLDGRHLFRRRVSIRVVWWTDQQVKLAFMGWDCKPQEEYAPWKEV